jgi:uncharacterized protein
VPGAPPRAVLDTNVLVRVLIRPGGATARLLGLFAEGTFRLVTSEPLIAELAATLRKPRVQRYAPLTGMEIGRAVRALRRAAEVVRGDFDVDLVPGDARDNPVAACALEAGADHIVTDDRKHLLPLKAIRVSGFRTVQITNVPAFIKLLRRR